MPEPITGNAAESHAETPAEGVSRRSFLRTTGAVVAAGAVSSPTRAEQAALHAGGSDVLRIGVIGCGGRGRGAAADAIAAGNGAVRIVALADAFQGPLDRCLRYLGEEAPEASEALDVPPERQFVGLDAYRGVLESDCDLVILATPPGFRPAHLEAAIAAGKHVFAEKPLAVDGAGVRQVMRVAEEAKRRNLAVGVGLQRRHDPRYIETIRRVHDGAIGDLRVSRGYWNGGGVWVRTRADFARANRRMPNELEYQVFNWYYFNWLSGDHIVEQHIHNLDVCNWLNDAHPVSANGMGGRAVRNGPDHGQIYDHHSVEFTYADGVTMQSQCRHQRGCWSAVHEDAFGSNGTVELGAGRPCRILSPGGDYEYSGPTPNPYVAEHVALQAAIRAGSPFNELPHGAEATMTAVLGRLATYSGKVVTWEEALNSDLALAPEMPESWGAEAPVQPDESGAYPVAVPGVTTVV